MLDFSIGTLSIDQNTLSYIGSLKQYAGWFLFAALLIYILFFPAKLEEFLSVVYKSLSAIFKEIPWLRKKYIEYDFQASVGSFNNDFLNKEIKGYKKIKVKVGWVDENSIPSSFLNEGELIVRMRKDDNKNKNFVNATMIFISECILIKAKKYISKKQGESIDLFIAKKMFDRKDESIVSEFVENYLQPQMDDKKIDNLFAKYDNIDRAGLFFPVFIQEMIFLGEKVFNQRKDSSIITEVNKMIDFLEMRSNKILGEDVESKFIGEYCKFGIIIVGKVNKIFLEGKKPYQSCIVRFGQQNLETFYLVGDLKNKDFITDFVCEKSMLGSIDYKIFNEKGYEAEICNENECWRVPNYLVVLRNNKIQHYHKASSRK